MTILMSIPPDATADDLNRLIREFMASLREHFTDLVTDEQGEVSAEVILAAIAAAVGGLLILLPRDKRRAGLGQLLIAAAIRLVSRK